MKLFKLIKSIDYVTYPTYKELVNISNSLNDSIQNIRDITISGIVAALFNATPVSKLFINFASQHCTSKTIAAVVNYENAALFLSIVLALGLFVLLKLCSFIRSRFISNKSTKKKRDIIVHEFYNVAIPQLIEVKSMLEQMQDDDSGENRKELLLLLQAKHEICDLYSFIADIRITEKDNTGVQTVDSTILSDRIGTNAYCTFLEEMLENMFLIYTELCNNYSDRATAEMKELGIYFLKTGVFDQRIELREKLEEIRAEYKRMRILDPVSAAPN